jgi:hypothetical protein
MNNVAIPHRMQRLERDRRGYPIPVAVYRDSTGRAHFTINDEAKRQALIAGDRCPICGGKLLRGRWFVGGPQSAFHSLGAYIDPPMHNECARYALQVCPYLAVRNYDRRIEDKTLPPGETPILIDNTMIPERPDYFVAVMTAGQKLIRDKMGWVQYLQPHRPYSRIEFWQHGKHVGKDAVAC